MRKETIKISETDIKNQIKDRLNLKGIFSYPLLQGVGSYKGLPDRVMHYKGNVIYLEIKRPKGKLSEFQWEFQSQCIRDNIDYWVVKSIEDMEATLEFYEAHQNQNLGEKSREVV
jgi:hypothetical protein